jgi:hypothetical protein
MRPRPIPRLSQEASRRFVEEDRRPLGDREKEYLRECLELYRKNPVRTE